MLFSAAAADDDDDVGDYDANDGDGNDDHEDDDDSKMTSTVSLGVIIKHKTEKPMKAEGHLFRLGLVPQWNRQKKFKNQRKLPFQSSLVTYVFTRDADTEKAVT